MEYAWRFIACLLVLAAAPSAAQSSLTYRERTGSQEITIRIRQDPLPQGVLIRSYLSDGEYYEVEYGPADTTVRYRVLSAARGLDYTATRDGNLIVFTGTFGGKPMRRGQRIDVNPWLETVERSLSGFSLVAGRSPVVFWIVNPWEAKAYLMQASYEGEDVVAVGGRRVDAVRVRVRPYGFFSMFWSSLYWYRLSDGLYLRYEAVRGLPGTPLTVVELSAEE